MSKEVISVEIAEYIGGYFRVTINGLPIAQYRDHSQAKALVDHFKKINEGKKIVQVD